MDVSDIKRVCALFRPKAFDSVAEEAPGRIHVFRSAVVTYRLVGHGAFCGEAQSSKDTGAMLQTHSPHTPNDHSSAAIP